jgi:oligopeptide transport system ATP-binding protein
VETGTADDLLMRPAHPYTEALLRSVPHGRTGGDLVPIPGTPPNLARLPSGCAFAPRCGWVTDKCWTARPDAHPLDRDRSSACHRAEEVLCAST